MDVSVVSWRLSTWLQLLEMISQIMFTVHPFECISSLMVGCFFFKLLNAVKPREVE